MTLIQIKNVLFDYFSKNDMYVVGTPLNYNAPVNQKDLFNALLIKGLEDLEQSGLITKVLVKDNPIWVLIQPLESYKQTVELSGEAANYVGNVLEKCAAKFGNGRVYTNKLNISQSDIIDCITLLEQFIDSQDHSNN